MEGQAKSSWFGTATETGFRRSEEHTSELQSRLQLVCRLLLEKKKIIIRPALARVPQTVPPPACLASRTPRARAPAVLTSLSVDDTFRCSPGPPSRLARTNADS